jgi:hypothetical protein
VHAHQSIRLSNGNKPENRAMRREQLGSYLACTAQQAKARVSALARLETALRLIDDVDAPLAPHDTVVAMAAAQGFQRVTDFHGNIPSCAVD